MTEKETATLWADAKCTLGEGPVWCRRRRGLVWTDIEGATLWMHTPATGTTRTWRLPDRAGSLALCASGRVLLGLAKGLAFADLDQHIAGVLPVIAVAPVEADEPRTRINDGRTDRAGNFVFGTMNEEHASTGARLGHIYQFSSRHGLRRMNIDPVAITNSICFSVDGRTMYFADSLDRRIMQADYDAATAHVENVREFARLSTPGGVPDGSIVDADGCLWSAVWGEGRLQRYSPDGVVVREIFVAATNTTCPAFGGADLTDLYVTSSRLEMDAQALARLPHAGGVFHIAPGVRGLPDAVFPDT
ncbi:MAG: SMP-30/gluconolactonase/LRE family protein [Acidobacteriota bacterium]